MYKEIGKIRASDLKVGDIFTTEEYLYVYKVIEAESYNNKIVVFKPYRSGIEFDSEVKIPLFSNVGIFIALEEVNVNPVKPITKSYNRLKLL